MSSRQMSSHQMSSKTGSPRRHATRGLWLLLLAAAPPAQGPTAGPLRTTVGMPGYLHGLVLPGSELEPAPATPASKVIVRIEQAHPHGTAWRYDLVVTGLEAGEHDLRAFLQRKDKTPTGDLSYDAKGDLKDFKFVVYEWHFGKPKTEVSPQKLRDQ